MTSNQPSKVRVACQRCRARRTRCDGGIPSCGNCAKAGVTCVDVDARNGERLIPRNAITQAKARIQWLEEIIGRELPHIDLSDGPRFDVEVSDSTVTGPNILGPTSRAEVDINTESWNESPVLGRSTKRAYSATQENDIEAPFQTEARSVAHDLGRLSLNADSKEKHYLGSSSGLIFSYLAQTGSPSESSDLSQSRSRNVPVGRRQVKQDYTKIYQKLSEALPGKENLQHLLELYVYNVHPDHPVLHIPSVLSAIEAVFLCKDAGPGVAVDNDGWTDNVSSFTYNGEVSKDRKSSIKLPTAMFHILMICAIGASIKLGDDISEHRPQLFYRTAMDIAPDVVGETSIASLQAIYLMSIYALMSPTKLNLWTLNYICMAHCIDLGLQRTQGEPSSTIQIVRSLLFYSIYSLDRSLATIQGRPLGLREETFDIQLPSLDNLYQELNGQSMAPVYGTLIEEGIQYTLHRFKLDKIISEIKSVFYFLPPKDKSTWVTENAIHQPRIRANLDTWFAEISHIASQEGIRDEEKKRWQLHLEHAYHAAIILVYQPSQVFRNPSSEALQQCLDASTSQLACFNTLHEQDSLQFDWRTVRSVFACGATIVYCFWMANVARTASQMENISASLRLCSNLLAIGGTTWPSVKKGRVSFERLVDLTLRKMNDVQKSPGQSRKKRLQAQDPSLATNVNISTGQPIGSAQPPALLTYSDQHLVNLPSTADIQWSENELDFGGYASVPGSFATGMSNESPVYMFPELNLQSSSVEPEIESFLTDFFMDDGSWVPWDNTDFQFSGT